MIKPMLCQSLPKEDLKTFLKLSHNRWICNEKMDGDRIMLHSKSGVLSLFNRKGNDVTRVYPEFNKLELPDCILDGEMIVKNDKGISDFNGGITHRSHCKTEDKIAQACKDYPAVLVVFDILEFDGHRITGLPLKDRMSYLDTLELEQLDSSYPIERITTFSNSEIITAWEDFISKGCEGIVLKDMNGLYYEGKRSGSWLKVKDVQEVDIYFTKYTTHNRGIRLESDTDIAITCNGEQSQEVKEKIINEGRVLVSVRHLGVTETGKLRQPTFLKLV